MLFRLYFLDFVYFWKLYYEGLLKSLKIMKNNEDDVVLRKDFLEKNIKVNERM